MFENDYKNEMNKISPDPETKNAIAEMLANGEATNQKRKMKKECKIWRISFAATAAAAVLLSILFIPKSPKAAVISKNEVKSTSYDEIYEKIAAVKDNYYDVTDGIMPTDDFAVPERTSNRDTYAGSENKGSASLDHSQTNNQVEGVDEADIIKTDGKYIYSLYDNEIRVLSAENGKISHLGTIDLFLTNAEYCNNFYLTDNRLVAISATQNLSYYARSAYSLAGYESITKIMVYDISDPESPKRLTDMRQSGSYTDSRLIGDKLYIVSEHFVATDNIDRQAAESFVPFTRQNGKTKTTPAECIRLYDTDRFSAVYTHICGYDITDNSLISDAAILGGSGTVYASDKNIITALTVYNESNASSQISRFAIDNGNISYKASSKINGTLLNQFSIDEYNGYFRFVVTTNSYKRETSETKPGGDDVNDSIASIWTNDTAAALYILDSNLIEVSSIENLAPDERVYSVRFMGDTAYFVTFRQVDPLFSVDLSNPKAPKIIGKLKIPGFSNYLFPFGEGKLLGIGQDANEQTGKTGDIKLSIFDISNPADVTESEKFLINGSSYSPALYNHKDTLLDTSRGFIGLIAESYGKNADYQSQYLLFRYSEVGFELKLNAALPSNMNSYGTRGIIIEDYLYIVSKQSVRSFELKNFAEIAQFEF